MAGDDLVIRLDHPLRRLRIVQVACGRVPRDVVNDVRRRLPVSHREASRRAAFLYQWSQLDNRSRRRARRIIARTHRRYPWTLGFEASIASPTGMGNDGQRAYDLATRTWYGSLVGTLSAAGKPFLDATASPYNADPHNIFDSTAGLQAWLNDISTKGPGYLPQGAYKISAALTLPLSLIGCVFFGDGWVKTTIYQNGNNVPIFVTAGETFSSLTFHDLHLEYINSQAGNANAIAIMLSTPLAGVGNGWYHWTVDRLQIVAAYTAFGFDPAGTGKYALWDFHGAVIHIRNTYHSGLAFVSPVNVGQPTNYISSLKILNTGSGITPDGPAIATQSMELEIDNLDIEDWANHHIQLTGTYPVSIRQVHLERMTLNAAPDWIISAGAARVRITDITLESTQGTPAFGAGVFEAIFQVLNGGDLTVENFKSNLVAPSSGAYQLVSAAATSGVRLYGIHDDTGGIGAANIPAPASDATTLNQIIIFDTQRVGNVTVPLTLGARLRGLTNPMGIDCTTNGGSVALRSNDGAQTDAATSGAAGGTFKVGGQLYPGAEATFATQTSGGFLHATGVPSNTHGNNNDWCISDNGHLYFRAAGVWGVII